MARAYQVSDATTRIPAIPAAPSVAQAAAQRLVPGERVFHNPYRTAQRPQPVSAARHRIVGAEIAYDATGAGASFARDLEQRGRPQASPAPQAVQSTQAASADAALRKRQKLAAATCHGALGLFQDSRPDVRSLFTHGVRG